MGFYTSCVYKDISMVFNYFNELYDRIINRFTRQNIAMFFIALVIAGFFIFPSRNDPMIFKNAEQCHTSGSPMALCQFSEYAARHYMKGKMKKFSTLEECQAAYHNGGCTNNMQSWNYPQYQPEMAGFSVTDKPPAPNDHSWGQSKSGEYQAYYIRGYYKSERLHFYRTPDSDERFKILEESHFPRRHRGLFHLFY